MNPAGLFNRTVTITSYTIARETMGSPIPTNLVSPDPTSICAIQPRSSSEGIEFQKDRSTKQAVGYFPYGTGLGPQYRITDNSSGDIWKVVGSPENVGGLNVYLRVNLEQEVA